MSKDDILKRTTPTKVLEFQAPEYWTSPLTSERCVSFMKRWGIFESYCRKAFTASYDPKQDRLVFTKYEGGKVISGSGRALTHGIIPKWYKYGSQDVVYSYGDDTSTCVLCEDIISALRVSDVATGVALLSTTLPDSVLSYVKGFARVYIALDPDARLKAVQMQNTLRYYSTASVLLLEDDPKYFTVEDVRCMLNCQNKGS